MLEKAKAFQRKAISQIPGSVELIATYFALVDPQVNPEKKALALSGAAGTGAVGAVFGSWVPILGTGAGAPVGFLIGAYYLLAKKRHVLEAERYLKTGIAPWDDYPERVEGYDLESHQAGGALRKASAGFLSKVNSRSRRNGDVDVIARYNRVLAQMRALQWAYWVAHWQVKGGQFYGDHLLLERLYKSFDESIDALGERIVARYGRQAFDSVKVGTQALQFLQSQPTLHEDPIPALQKMEQELKASTKAAWATANEMGDIAADDFFMGLANDQDTRIYLLGQRTKANGHRTRRNTSGWIGENWSTGNTMEFPEGPFRVLARYTYDVACIGAPPYIIDHGSLEKHQDWKLQREWALQVGKEADNKTTYLVEDGQGQRWSVQFYDGDILFRQGDDIRVKVRNLEPWMVQRAKENRSRASSEQGFTFGKKTAEGYPVITYLNRRKLIVGYLPTRSREKAIRMIRAAQLQEIRANTRRKR